MDISELYRQARTVAAEAGIVDEDLILMGLDPSDQWDFVLGVGDYLFLTQKNMQPIKARSWDKMEPGLRKFYLKSTDFLATLFDETGHLRPQ